MHGINKSACNMFSTMTSVAREYGNKKTRPHVSQAMLKCCDGFCHYTTSADRVNKPPFVLFYLRGSTIPCTFTCPLLQFLISYRPIVDFAVFRRKRS